MYFRFVSLILGAVALLHGSSCSAEAQVEVVRTGRFTRGTGTNASYHSFVIPLDLQKGFACSNTGGFGADLYPWTSVFGSQYHYNATNPASATNLAFRLNTLNPIVGFGSRAGGTPLYFGQPYGFGIYSGQIAPYYADSVLIRTFQLTPTNILYLGSAFVPLPNPSNTNEWNTYLTNGYEKVFTTNGLTTIVRFDQNGQRWGSSFAGQLTLTHSAVSSASDYVFEIGLAALTDKGDMVVTGTGLPDYCRMYNIEFEARPAWRSTLIDQPHFDGIPLPPEYEGKSIEQLLTNQATVATTFSLPQAPATYTNLDHSPELRRHPMLDQFVSDMGRDPVALARHVYNEIELTDAVSYNDNGSLLEVSVNPPGVSRGALATFQEKQGGPAEQCALLVYLLRQAGTPAVYVYPPHNTLTMLDTRLSRLLRLQFRGAVNSASGQVYSSNKLIAVNFPWVAAYIGTNWVHLFPWLKDTEIIEGMNLYDYMGTNYRNGFRWMSDYLHGKTNILSLASSDDTPAVLFPKFVQNQLSANAPGLSLDDMGVRFLNRRKGYARWQDFPTPFSAPTNGVALDTLSSTAITNVFAKLTNIFDTYTVEISSQANPAQKISSGEVRLVDLHNRRFLIQHVKTGTNTHDVILSLAAFRPGATGTTNFAVSSDLLNVQFVRTNLTSTDDWLDVKLTYRRHRSLPTSIFTNPPTPYVNYPAVNARMEISDTRSLRKGDLAAICLNVGRVSKSMLEVHAQELWNMERAVALDTNNLPAADLYQGETTYLLGMAYFENVSRFREQNQKLHKTHVLSQVAHGLAKLSAKRVAGVLPNNGDITLIQPNVDMSFYDASVAFNGTIHSESGQEQFDALDNFRAIDAAHASAQEHQILNLFFQQTDAISTVKLLQLAEKRKTNNVPGLFRLTPLNFTQIGNSNLNGTLLKNYDPSLWLQVSNHLTRPLATANQVFITPGAVTNSSNSYKGVGAFNWSPLGYYAAAISPNQNGGFANVVPDNTFTPVNSANFSLRTDPLGNFYYDFSPPSSGNRQLASDNVAFYDHSTFLDNASADYFYVTQPQTDYTRQIANAGLTSLGGTASQQFGQASQADQDRGFLGWVQNIAQQAGGMVADPVAVVSGEFYHDEVDLSLPGPMPLQLRRNYSSLNLAENQFGHGWKVNYTPFLSISADTNLIYAAEADGAVLAYEKQTGTNLWVVTASRNPLLDNHSKQGIGSTANRMRQQIIRTSSDGKDNYTLSGVDGSLRFYQTAPFAGFSPLKPYLLLWQDNRGNAHTFEYGTNSTQPDFAQVRRILSSSGNLLGLNYDIYGHIIEAYTQDGRRIQYDYDQFGDLVKVTRPDGSEIRHEYEHRMQSVTNGSTITLQTYSTHLLIRETKPDGRLLVNQYDNQRRVTNQLATVGPDLRPVRNATFVYANNFKLSDPMLLPLVPQVDLVWTNFNAGNLSGATNYGFAHWTNGGGALGVSSGALALTDAYTSQAGSVVINEITPGVPVLAFAVNFKLRIADGSPEPADGFGFNFGNDLPNAASGARGCEEGGPTITGLGISVDNFRFAPYPSGGVANTAGMKIRYNNTDIAGVQFPAPWNSPNFVSVSIALTTNGILSVYVDGTNVFGNLALNWVPIAGRFGFFARTGGAIESHWIDDLAIGTMTASCGTNCTTTTITGTTTIYDINNNPTVYQYQDGLITSILDPLGIGITQSWWQTNESNLAGYYPRSLKRSVDRRGLITDLFYDSNGNLLTNIVSGDLTGNGTNSQAISTSTFDTNNLPLVTTDPAGNQVQRLYHCEFPWLPEQMIRLAGSTPVSTNLFSYYSVTNVISNGGISITNIARGLLQQEIRAYQSADAATTIWTHDGRGFPVQQTRLTGNSDPAVVMNFTYNGRGEMIEQRDAANRMQLFTYDGLGRAQSREVFNENSVRVAWDFTYRNDNGEVTWIDGPRYNPEDYVWRDYDGAGRQVQEIRWRSQFSESTLGVEAVPGDALYATTFQEWDGFGNLQRTVNPRGHITTNRWDAIGRLIEQRQLSSGGELLAANGYAYEPGNQVRYHTNALGGVTETLHTMTGQPRYRSQPDGSTNGWTYYVDGRIEREVQRNGTYWLSIYDDANLKATRIFYSRSGVALATNVSEFDRRGNLTRRTDANGFSFTNIFDGLDRLKFTAGPVLIASNPPGAPSPGGSPQPVQQTSVIFYDAAGKATTNVNALGEKTITFFDALARPIRMEVRNSGNVVVRESTTAYRADHHGMTVTNGSGTAAIVSTTLTDNQGQPVLTMAYPGSGVREYTRTLYNINGSKEDVSRRVATNSAPSVELSYWLADFDELNRPVYEIQRDAMSLFSYDAMGNVTNRAMPGELIWRASYNNAGQILKEFNLGTGNAGARTNSYNYFGSSSPWAGLLQTRTDGRGVACTHLYDDWLRAATNTYSGTLAEHALQTERIYDARGQLITTTEIFSSNTSPRTVVHQTYDGYGLLKSESTTVDGITVSSASANWNSAGRRASLGFGLFGFAYDWRADGTMTSVTSPTGGGTYAYDSAGLLTNRTVGARVSGITSRDGMGRTLAVATKIAGVSYLAETLTWTGDGLLNTHGLVRPDYTDSQGYLYHDFSRRLAEERLNVSSSTRWTNKFTYDGGTAEGPGVLTRITQASTTSNVWSAARDAFQRVNSETNASVRRPAYGRIINGPATVSLLLDGKLMPVSLIGTQEMQWRATMEMGPGAHQLQAYATQLSGLFTTNKVAWFTNNAANEIVSDIFDSSGQLTQRTWKTGSTTNRTQSLSWDGRGRLWKVIERDASNSGFNWTALYDAFGRRLVTTNVLVTNGVAVTSQPKTISQIYDPSVEFLELAVNEDGRVTWKLYGPDLNGSYGGLNGTGGFDAIIPGANLFCPTISDARGNLHAVYDQTYGSLTWNPARPTGYGAVPGYRPAPLSHGASIVGSAAWRGRWTDLTGLTWLGARYYDPIAGHFLSADPLGHASDVSLYAFANGDPVNGFDPDGRFGKNIYEQGVPLARPIQWVANQADNFANSTDTPLLAAAAGYFSYMWGAGAQALTPATYVNGLQSYGNNVNATYQDGGLVRAGSYAITSWNMGAVMAGAANQNQVTGEPLGDWMGPRGSEFFSGIAGTAGVVTGGQVVYNWAPATVATEIGAGVKYIGKLDDLQGIPRSQTLLDDLPDLGSPRANYYQNSSVLRKALRDGYDIRDASAYRPNSSPDPTLLRPDRTVGQSFLGAERNILDNKGLTPSPNGTYVPK